MDIERYWDGTRWTARTRDRVSKMERVPLAEPARTNGLRRQHREVNGAASQRGLGRLFTILTTVLVVVGFAGYVGALPSWAHWPEMLTRGVPSGPNVAYPVFGSNSTVTYLARNLVAQETDIDVTWIQASGGDVRSVVQDAMNEAVTQNPYAFTSGWGIFIESARVRVEPVYTYTDKEAQRRRVAISSAVEAITASPEVAQAPDDRTKVQAIHHAVLRAATYDYAAFAEITAGVGSKDSAQVAQSQEAYGILIDGTAVCAGYAQAFQVLAQASGLKSVVVTGIADGGITQGGHAWNRVWVDGTWLVVDTTWDDGDDTQLGTDYLMISSQDPLMATRSQDSDWIVNSNMAHYGG